MTFDARPDADFCASGGGAATSWRCEIPASMVDTGAGLYDRRGAGTAELRPVAGATADAVAFINGAVDERFFGELSHANITAERTRIRFIPPSYLIPGTAYESHGPSLPTPRCKPEYRGHPLQT